MARANQPDLFQADEQSNLFGEDTPTPEYRADPDSVRAELYKILAEARAAQKLPWEPKTVLLYRTIFPQMTNWRPDAAGAQLRFEFEAEIKRLEAARDAGWIEFSRCRLTRGGTPTPSLCDQVVNELYANIVLEGPPAFFWSVFLAFDAGEYYHDGNRSIDPKEAYTRPKIAQIIHRHISGR